MSSGNWTFEQWVGLAVRLFFGALLGAVIAFTSLHFWDVGGGGGLNWLYAIGVIVVCAVLAARFGDAFWSGLLGRFHWWS
jgi:hypothetical protein